MKSAVDVFNANSQYLAGLWTTSLVGVGCFVAIDAFSLYGIYTACMTSGVVPMDSAIALTVLAGLIITLILAVPASRMLGRAKRKTSQLFAESNKASGKVSIELTPLTLDS